MAAALVFLVTHSWSSKPTLEQEECYRITVFASKNPKNPMLWATVLSSYYFGGNGESTVEEGVVCVGGVAAGGAFPSVPLLTEALYSLESRYSTPRVG